MGRACRCDLAAVDVQRSFIAVLVAVVINASVARVGWNGADQRAGAFALCIDIQGFRLCILAVQGNALVQRHRHSVAEDQVNGAKNLKRVIRCNVGIGGEPCLVAHECALKAVRRQHRAVCLCLHRAVRAHVGELVCGALRDGGIAHHAVVVFAAACGLLAAFILIAIAAVQQVRRCAVGVPDAASVRYIGGIAAAGKGHPAVVMRHRVLSDLQSVGVLAVDRTAADAQRSAFDVYALFSGERAAQNIRRAAAGQKYRAVLVTNNVARSAFIARRDLDGAALHRQSSVVAYMDRLTAVGLHDLTAAVGALILNGQAAAVIDVKYSVPLDKVARPTGRLDRAAVQVQSNIAACQLDAVAITVSVFGDRHIRQQLHRGARLQLRGVKRRHNVGVLLGRAADGDLRHAVIRARHQGHCLLCSLAGREIRIFRRADRTVGIDRLLLTAGFADTLRRSIPGHAGNKPAVL